MPTRVYCLITVVALQVYDMGTWILVMTAPLLVLDIRLEILSTGSYIHLQMKVSVAAPKLEILEPYNHTQHLIFVPLSVAARVFSLLIVLCPFGQKINILKKISKFSLESEEEYL